ncbi:MAG: polyprenyl synthetase family protein, partial [Mucinivorans sp.]
MSQIIKEISAPIEEELAELKIKLQAAIASPYHILGPISTSIIELRGKMMRPLLGLLVAKLHQGQVNEQVYATAVLFELLHHATLVHDDVIDEAYLRRGEATLGAMLRSRSAVLVGDFMFAKGLTAASTAGAFAQIEIATRAIERVVEGELAQSENQHRQSLLLQDYINVVELKTSSLLSGVAQASALAAKATQSQQEAMQILGNELGIAFQIQDDILDYIGSAATGKALYNDIRECKITLPLLLAVENGGHRASVLSWLRKGNVAKVVEYVKLNKG